RYLSSPRHWLHQPKERSIQRIRSDAGEPVDVRPSISVTADTSCTGALCVRICERVSITPTVANPIRLRLPLCLHRRVAIQSIAVWDMHAENHPSGGKMPGAIHRFRPIHPAPIPSSAIHRYKSCGDPGEHVARIPVGSGLPCHVVFELAIAALESGSSGVHMHALHSMSGPKTVADYCRAVGRLRLLRY